MTTKQLIEDYHKLLTQINFIEEKLKPITTEIKNRFEKSALITKDINTEFGTYRLRKKEQTRKLLDKELLKHDLKKKYEKYVIEKTYSFIEIRPVKETVKKK